MQAPIVILALLGSEFSPRLAAAIESRGASSTLLSLDAPFQGKPVTVRPGEVLWEGVDLRCAGALFLEAPLYSWPQPQEIRDLPADPAARTRRLAAEREARALALSAIFIAAETCPVVNPPEAASLAVAPGIALDRLASKNLPLNPWSLGPAPDQARAGGRVVIDAAGRDSCRRPSHPPAGEPALILDRIAGSVVTCLVVGGRIAGAHRHASGEASAEGCPGETLHGDEIASPAADMASRAAGSLGLHVAAVSMEERGAPRIFFVEAGPDLACWDATLNRSLAPVLADHLISTARERGGVAR